MKFIIIVLIVRSIIALVDKRDKREEKITVARNDLKDPAAFQVR